jgi:putative inorganic carbon (HCO3(-)) transporter
MSADALQVIGCIAAAGAAGLSLLTDDRRLRAAGLLAALGIALVLLVGEAWDSLEPVRDEPAKLAGVVLAAAGVIAALSAGLLRWRLLLPLAIVAALPFRVPVDSGADQANLLVPLYAVIAAGAVVVAIEAVRASGRVEHRIPRALRLVMAAAVLLYAVQVSYSEDLDFATRNVAFFLVPFAAMFALLADVRWSPKLLGGAAAVLIAEALLFSLVGITQHFAGHIFWNSALEMSNDFHFYFRVNSLFWDPNIYGRYLALAVTLALAVLLWTRDSRRAALLAGVIAVLFAGMTFSFSQTSFLSMLAGVTVLAALRWSWRWTAVGVVIVLAATFISVKEVGGLSDSAKTSRGGADDVTSGHSTLIEGGAKLFANRPLQGYGSASFSDAFADNEHIEKGETTVSHNEPVTVAAEQGLPGVLAYLAVLGVALLTLTTGIRAVAPGLGAPEDAVPDPLIDDTGALPLARLAVLAAFCALLVHTIGYAGYLSDPLTWVLLGVGGALAPELPPPRKLLAR